jgi:hypothetical protein
MFLVFLVLYMEGFELKDEKIVTYNSTRSLKCSFFRVALVHDHSVWVGSCWDNHCSVGATSLDSSVVHYILWEVLTIIYKDVNNQPCLTSIIQMTPTTFQI